MFEYRVDLHVVLNFETNLPNDTDCMPTDEDMETIKKEVLAAVKSKIRRIVPDDFWMEHISVDKLDEVDYQDEPKMLYVDSGSPVAEKLDKEGHWMIFEL
jgi:hypothetical protein